MARDMTPRQLALAGMDLREAQARRLEVALDSNPDDVGARTKLLGFYGLPSYTDRRARRRRTAHCLWIVRNHPEAQIAGLPFCRIERVLDRPGWRRLDATWRRQIRLHSDVPAVLSNAAHFFGGTSSRTAVALLQRLQRMEPRNPEWKDRLGHLYYLRAMTLPGRKRNKGAAVMALEQWQAALRLLRTNEDRFYALTYLAPVAVDAGRQRLAARYATSLLRRAGKFRNNWNHGNAVHKAHTTLGRVALRAGRRRDAVKQLLASAKTRGSPQLNSFGPGQDLAAELLAAGEAEAVLRYLERCRSFWRMGAREIDAWSRSIRESGTTDFLPVFDVKGQPS